MSLRERHRVTIHGEASRPTLVLVHGYGCDQAMWGRLVPELEGSYQVVTYDQAGSGPADPAAYDEQRHASLDGYADDLVGICTELGMEDVVVVGHSIAAMIGLLAHLRAPDLVAGLVMVGPSPRFVDAPPYLGGFSREDVEQMLQALSEDFYAWVESAAPRFMAQPGRPELAEELAASLRRTDPRRAAEFARVTFLADVREHLDAVRCPTLVIQATDDPLVPEHVGEYVRDRIPGSTYATVEGSGHFLHVSAPQEIAHAILAFLGPIRSFLRRTRS